MSTLSCDEKGNAMTTSKKKASVRLGSLLSTALAPFAKRFIAGTTITQALEAVAKLNKTGYLTKMDHLGEDVTSEAEARHAAEEYVIMIKGLAQRKCDRNVSLKLSSIGLNINKEFCFQNLERVIKTAEENGAFVRVDMEGSAVTTDTIELVKRAKKNRSTPIGCVLQAMMHRTPDDVVGLLEKEITIRLCKGAYKEPKEIAFQRLTDVRAAYMSLAKRLLTSGMYHGIATHDPLLIAQVKKFVIDNNIPRDSFEFQMLIGMKPRLQKRLLAEGWRLRLYVPFGSSWLPYMLRRLREKKENMLFLLTSLF